MSRGSGTSSPGWRRSPRPAGRRVLRELGAKHGVLGLQRRAALRDPPGRLLKLRLRTFRATIPASRRASTPIHSWLRVILTITPESAMSPTAPAVRRRHGDHVRRRSTTRRARRGARGRPGSRRAGRRLAGRAGAASARRPARRCGRRGGHASPPSVPASARAAQVGGARARVPLHLLGARGDGATGQQLGLGRAAADGRRAARAGTRSPAPDRRESASRAGPRASGRRSPRIGRHRATAATPPEARGRASRARELTAIRIAWKLRFAGWPRPNRAAGGSAARIASASSRGRGERRAAARSRARSAPHAAPRRSAGWRPRGGARATR